MNNVWEMLGAIANMCAIPTLLFGVVTYFNQLRRDKKRATVAAFAKLQDDVLDKLAHVDRKNAQTIVQNYNENADCKKAYHDYRTLIARLEHFAVEIDENIYDLKTVDKLAGSHLIYTYKHIEPIIQKANAHVEGVQYYRYFTDLVEKLSKRHPEIKM